MELALWKLKIASMVPVLLRFASIALLAAPARPAQAMIMELGDGVDSVS